jgi:hypothetical protein
MQQIAFFDHSVANILISSFCNLFFNNVEKTDVFSIILLSHLQFIDVESALMMTTYTVFHDSWFQTFVVLWKFYAFFWVISRRLNFICRRFKTLCLFHLHRWTDVVIYICPPMKMEQSVPKHRHIKFRLRGITHKKAYNSISWSDMLLTINDGPNNGDSSPKRNSELFYCKYVIVVACIT